MTEKDRQIMEDCIERMTKSLSDVLLLEIQELKNDVREVKDQVTKINGSVRNLSEWKCGHQAMHDTQNSGVEKNLKTVGMVIAFMAMASGLFFGFRNTNEKVEVLKKNVESQDRYLQWKFGETPVNPTTRGKPLRIDTIR